MADSAAELERKIFRLNVQFDKMADTRVEERRALEDEIRALRDQLDELRRPPSVKSEPARDKDVDSVAKAKEAINVVEDIFGAKSPAQPSSPTADQNAAEALGFVAEVAAATEDPSARGWATPAQKAARERELAAQAAAAEEKLLHPAAAELEKGTEAALEAGPEAARGKDAKTKQMVEESQKQGCITPPKVLTAIGIGAAVTIAVILVVLNGGTDDDKTKASAGAGAGTNAAANSTDSSSAGPMDGHWVLASGLQEPTGKDTSLQGLGTGTLPPGWQVTLDKSSATIDISGDKITGGTYTTGITGANGDPCQTEQSKVDLKATGGVDQAVGYGQLILDGVSTTIKFCDTNHQQVVETVPNYHTAHYFYVKDDTLFLCYAINSTTFDSCTDPAGGSAATFRRG